MPRFLRRTSCAAIALVVGGLTGCHGPDPAVIPSPAPAAPSSVSDEPSAIVAPPANGRFDYQIGGSYPPAAGVTIVDRDRDEPPVSGIYSICYVNAFQTQPGDKKFWVGRHRSLLVTRKGKLVTDPDWPGEYLLNTSTAAKRKKLIGIVGPWIDRCARDGYQAVEPDNLDSWTRSKKKLTKTDNVAFATRLADRAHAAGLAIAQKNTSELGRTGRSKIGFDFAIAEECQVYDECDAYTDVFGASVIEIEYTDNPRRAYADACAARGATISIIRRDRDVVPAGRSAYRYENC